MTQGPLLALIPAKGASTRLRRKNLYRLGGRTLTARAIDCAIQSGRFDAVVVTTEDEEIAQEARRAGAAVPFIRPPRLAVDPAGVVDVTLHALDELQARGQSFATVAILLPTSPLRTPNDVCEALDRYAACGADVLMSVCVYEHTPLAALRARDDGFIEPFLPEWLSRLGARSSGPLPRLVRSNGAVTICDVARLRREREYYISPLAAYEMPWERSVDVDTEIDLQLAEFLLARQTSASGG